MTIPYSHVPAWPWRNPPAPSSPLYDRAITPGPRFGLFIGHAHVFRPQPAPPMDAYAYEGLGLAEFSPIGPATINRNHLWPFGPPPLSADLGLRTTGLGGLVQGQIISAPLIVPQDQLSEPLGTPLEAPFGG